MQRIASRLALAVLVAVAAVSCADTAERSAPSRPAPQISAPTTTTTAPPPPPTTAPCAPDASLTAARAAPVPPDLADALAVRVADPRFAATDYGVAKFKVPEQVVIWDALPKNDAGKILKHQIRATLAEG